MINSSRVLRLLLCSSFTATAIAFAAPAVATEGALGRVVPGANLQPKAGIVPDVPIVAVNVTSVYFDGEIGADTKIPLTGDIALGLRGEVSMTPITVLKVWDTPKGRWNFASAVTVPLIWNRVSGDLSVGGATRSVSETNSGVFDLLITPVIAGYHFSPTSHASMSLGVWAPTGGFRKGRIANYGLNYWTVTPTVAYTKLVPSQGFEFTAQTGLQFNSRNDKTDYKSAPLLTVDALVSKSVGSGFAIGGNASFVQQLGNDKGALADRLNGFVGHSLAIGPTVGWSGVMGNRPVEATLRWTPTIASANRLSGDALMFTFSVPLVLPKSPN